MAAKRMVASGRLGRVHHVRVSLWRRRGIPGLGRWFTTRARSGGGVLIDLGVHLFDLVMDVTGCTRAERVSGSCASLFGSPIEQYSFSEMWGGPPDPQGVFDVEDSAVGLIRFDGGVTMELNAAWAANLPEGALRDGVVVLGDRGGMYFDIWGDRLLLAGEHDGALEDVVSHVSVGSAWDEAWRRQSATFAGHVVNRTAPAATAEHGRAVQAILEAFYRSSEEGREVEVPA
jgi:predicted dehydrogenase